MGLPNGLDIDHQRNSGVKDFEDQATGRAEVSLNKIEQALQEKAKHLIWDIFILSYL